MDTCGGHLTHVTFTAYIHQSLALQQCVCVCVVHRSPLSQLNTNRGQDHVGVLNNPVWVLLLLLLLFVSLSVKTETQIPTQRYGRRPYGVGLLIAGYDVSLQSHTHTTLYEH